METNRYKELLRSRVQAAIAQALIAKNSISHSGVKGDIVEILIKELFQPLLPSDIGIGTGQIIENNNNLCSTQQDIILYDKSILPPILFQHNIGIFPVESVLYTIEVKTTLNAEELRKSHKAAGKLIKFGFLPGQTDSRGNPKHHKIESPISVLFALTSDLTSSGKSEAQRYKEIYGSDYPFLSAICVAGKEYWYESRGGWINVPAKDKYDEVLSFIGGVMNTYRSIASSRGNPKLGNYIIDTPENNDFINIPSGTEPILNVVCENCSNKGYIYFGNSFINLNSKDGFTASDPCCKCGGKLVAPSGEYQLIGGELFKIGEFKF